MDAWDFARPDHQRIADFEILNVAGRVAINLGGGGKRHLDEGGSGHDHGPVHDVVLKIGEQRRIDQVLPDAIARQRRAAG